MIILSTKTATYNCAATRAIRTLGMYVSDEFANVTKLIFVGFLWAIEKVMGFIIAVHASSSRLFEDMLNNPVGFVEENWAFF